MGVRLTSKTKIMIMGFVFITAFWPILILIGVIALLIEVEI
jgi:hypothetical protein